MTLVVMVTVTIMVIVIVIFKQRRGVNTAPVLKSDFNVFTHKHTFCFVVLTLVASHPLIR